MNALSRLFSPTRRGPATSFCDSCGRVATPASRAAAHLDQARTAALRPGLAR